jgi:hypothetical protein
MQAARGPELDGRGERAGQDWAVSRAGGLWKVPAHRLDGCGSPAEASIPSVVVIRPKMGREAPREKIVQEDVRRSPKAHGFARPLECDRLVIPKAWQ